MTKAVYDTIRSNLSRIRENVTMACDRAGRDPNGVTLIAVTKSVGPDEVRMLFDLGVEHFGESRLHEAHERIAAIPHEEATWHMVGHIQRRKARGVVETFDRIDSVDRMSLAETLEKHAKEKGARLPVLAEVNVSGEEAKHGFAPDGAGNAIAALREMEHLDIQGLMTMAPRTDDPESVRGHFAALRRIGEREQLPELSMGMSEDYLVAVEEGATQIRVGRALFRE